MNLWPERCHSDGVWVPFFRTFLWLPIDSLHSICLRNIHAIWFGQCESSRTGINVMSNGVIKLMHCSTSLPSIHFNVKCIFMNRCFLFPRSFALYVYFCRRCLLISMTIFSTWQSREREKKHRPCEFYLLPPTIAHAHTHKKQHRKSNPFSFRIQMTTFDMECIHSTELRIQLGFFLCRYAYCRQFYCFSFMEMFIGFCWSFAAESTYARIRIRFYDIQMTR